MTFKLIFPIKLIYVRAIRVAGSFDHMPSNTNFWINLNPIHWNYNKYFPKNFFYRTYAWYSCQLQNLTQYPTNLVVSMLIRLAHTARRGSLPSCTTDSGTRLGCPQMQRETAEAQNQRKAIRHQPLGVLCWREARMCQPDKHGCFFQNQFELVRF